MNNIKKNCAYKFNLSSKRPTYILILDHIYFREIQFGATNLIKTFQNQTRIDSKDINTKMPRFNHIERKTKNKLDIQ